MRETDVTIPPGAEPTAVELAVEVWGGRLGLQRTLKGTLARCPGCIHWHFKHGRERGTLEVTWWPRQSRLWLSVQAGRAGEWIDGAAADLKAALEDADSWK